MPEPMAPSSQMSPVDDLSSSQHYLLHEQASAQAEFASQPQLISGDTDAPSRSLSVWNAFTLLVLTQIGAGLFASPAQVDSNVPSPGVALCAWLFACLLGWSGAASFADLASLFPTGGMEEYLARFYDDTLAFLMAWTWITVVKPSSMAMVSTVLVESLFAGIAYEATPATKKLVTMSAFIAIVVPNLHSTRTSTRISNLFFGIKLTTVAVIIIFGVVAVARASSSATQPVDWSHRHWFATRPSSIGDRRIDWTQLNLWDAIGHFCTAIYAVLWACTGWDNANFVAREMRNPAEDLPRAIHGSMSLVTICYQLVNLSFYILVPWDDFGSSESVAVSSAMNLFGPLAATFIAILVALVAAGTVSANVFIIGRLTLSASSKGYIPRVFGYKMTAEHRVAAFDRLRSRISSLLTFGARHTRTRYRQVSNDNADSLGISDHQTTAHLEPPTTGVPAMAIVLNFILTSFYVVFGSFRILITFNGTAVYTFYFLTLLGLLRYRFQELRRNTSRNHEAYNHVLAPGLFSLVSFVIILRTVIFLPLQAAILTGLLLAGVIVRRSIQRHGS